MRHILTIARLDLRLLIKPSTVIATYVPLILITVVIGLLTGGSTSSTYLIDVVRADTTSPLAAGLWDALRAQGSTSFVFCDVAGKDQADACALKDAVPGSDPRAFAEDRLKKATTVGFVYIPADLGQTITGGTAASLDLITSGQNTAQIVGQKVGSAVTQINASIVAARLIRDNAPSSGNKAAIYDSVYGNAQKIWASDPVTIDEQTSGTVNAAGTGFGQSAPGIGSMFVLSVLLNIATEFVEERRGGTLQRLLTLPVTRAQVLAGKLLGRYVYGLVMWVVIILLGAAFGVQWGDPLAVIAVILVFTLAVTAIGLAVSTFVRSTGQAEGVQLLLLLTLAPLGGAWWPLGIVPGWMQTLAKISPIAWSQEAFGKLIFYGGHLPDILTPLAVLIGFAAVFFALGLARFQYE